MWLTVRRRRYFPKLSRELGINDLAQRVEAFRKEPSPEGEISRAVSAPLSS